MPLERVSKEFKDISMSFQVNPFTYDLIAIKNETAISRSVRNLVLTLQGERFFNQNLGSGVNKLLFDNMDELTAASIQSEIRTVINNYEPRVELISINATPNYDENQYDINIVYRIIGIDVLPQQLSFALIPTR
jgi:phage baseplate assembly protein W